MLQEKLQTCSFSCNMKSVVGSSLADAEQVLAVARAQRGVFSKADLQVLTAERHPAAFTRRVQALLRSGVLRRFVRGMYVAAEFDLPTLSQRLAPDSYVSFGTVLARHLLIGPSPDRQLLAATTGRGHRYRGLGIEIAHVHIGVHLDFGHTVVDGVRWADAEKAVLDTLYFHLRGRRFPFDVYSDVDVSRLDAGRLADYLSRFRNPKFVTFASRVLAVQA
jgi:hypothetical protein